MKKLLLFALWFVFCTFSTARASQDLFNINDAEIDNELAGLIKLENHLTETGIIDLAELTASHPSLLKDMDLSGNISIYSPHGMAFTIEDMQWESFAWGFCCWPIGIFTVLLNPGKDSDHKISYLIGLVFASFLWGGFWGFGRGRF